MYEGTTAKERQLSGKESGGLSMKGFIEIHRQSGGVCLISVSGIDTIATGGGNYRGSHKATIWLKSDPDNEVPINPVESYDEIKCLIEQAQEGWV